MVDYGNTPRHHIEHVDHEIHILGVKLVYLAFVLEGFLLGLPLGGPLIGLCCVVLAIVLCRASFAREQRGEPVTLSPRMVHMFGRLPASARRLVGMIFPTLTAVECPRVQYRD